MLEEIWKIHDETWKLIPLINDDEEWKFIPDFNSYAFSSYGRVISFRCTIPKILDVLTTKGRPRFTLVKNDGDYVTKPLSRLIALAFLGECPRFKEVSHLDDNPFNNHIDNLCYESHQMNINRRELRKRKGAHYG